MLIDHFVREEPVFPTHTAGVAVHLNLISMLCSGFLVTDAPLYLDNWIAIKNRLRLIKKKK